MLDPMSIYWINGDWGSATISQTICMFFHHLYSFNDNVCFSQLTSVRRLKIMGRKLSIASNFFSSPIILIGFVHYYISILFWPDNLIGKCCFDGKTKTYYVLTAILNFLLYAFLGQNKMEIPSFWRTNSKSLVECSESLKLFDGMHVLDCTGMYSQKSWGVSCIQFAF